MKRSARSRATRAAAVKSVADLLTSDTAIDGTPSRKPSVAAATVPEYTVSSPMLAP
jgi:hypothetical protein